MTHSNPQPEPGRHGPDNVLARRLSILAPLAEDDEAALDRMAARVSMAEPRTELFRQGDIPDGAVVILDGFACRYRHRANGQRQILSYILPGDLVGGDGVDRHFQMDHTIGALTRCRISRVPHEKLGPILSDHPRILHALNVAQHVEEASARERIISLGCRSALERTAHFLCETLARMEAVGLAMANSCDFPISQMDLADTLGLSLVHTNRTLQTLRAKKLIEIRHHRLSIIDLPELQSLAEFVPTYLRPKVADTGPAATDGAAGGAVSDLGVLARKAPDGLMHESH